MKTKTTWILIVSLLVGGLGIVFIPMLFSEKFTFPWESITKLSDLRVKESFPTVKLDEPVLEESPVLMMEKSARSMPSVEESLTVVDRVLDSLKNLVGTLSSVGALLLLFRQLKEKKKSKKT